MVTRKGLLLIVAALGALLLIYGLVVETNYGFSSSSRLDNFGKLREEEGREGALLYEELLFRLEKKEKEILTLKEKLEALNTSWLAEQLRVKELEQRLGEAAPQNSSKTSPPPASSSSSSPEPTTTTSSSSSSPSSEGTSPISTTEPGILIPYSLETGQGLVEGSKLIIRGTFLGEEFLINLHSISDTILFHMNPRPQTKILAFNTFDKSWQQDILAEVFPFETGREFVLEIVATQRTFEVSINYQLVHIFPFRFEELLPSALGFTIDCRTGRSCVSISKVGTVNIQGVEVNALQPTQVALSKETKLRLFIGVISSPDYQVKREAVRSSWMRDPAIIKNGTVAARFFIGKSKDPAANELVKEEMERYQDIVLVESEEDYRRITYKTAAIIEYGSKYTGAQFIMKCDDDTFVNVDLILTRLKLAPSTNLYMGTISYGGGPIRDPNNKWYMSYEDYPDSEYPPFAHGPGYIMSRDLAAFLTEQKEQNELKMLELEDVAVSTWVDHVAKAHDTKIHYIHEPRFVLSGCTPNGLIGHYIEPVNMKCMWRKKSRGMPNICC